MSKARHHMKRASGGGIGDVPETGKKMVYAGADSNVLKEAEKRKRGGKVGAKAPAMVEGKAPKHHRLDRPGRKRGGAVGADSSPMTEASRLSCPPGVGGGASTDKADD